MAVSIGETQNQTVALVSHKTGLRSLLPSMPSIWLITMKEMWPWFVFKFSLKKKKKKKATKLHYLLECWTPSCLFRRWKWPRLCRTAPSVFVCVCCASDCDKQGSYQPCIPHRHICKYTYPVFKLKCRRYTITSRSLGPLQGLPHHTDPIHQPIRSALACARNTYRSAFLACPIPHTMV